MTEGGYMTAQEAAAELGISLATLYSYVSRGYIRSEAADERRRTRRYRREDVWKLKQRKEQRRNPEKAAAGALHWGTPVLESAISLIAENRLYYRGHDVLQLASHSTVEEVAALIWAGALSTDIPGLSQPDQAAYPARLQAVRARLQDG